MANVLEARRRARRIRDLMTERLEREVDGYQRELMDVYTEWALHPTSEATEELRSLIRERIRDMCEKIAQAGGAPPPAPPIDTGVPGLIADMLNCETKYVATRARHSAAKYHGFLAGWEAVA